jgi:iron only hydrogenase large subunit-like protein
MSYEEFEMRLLAFLEEKFNSSMVVDTSHFYKTTLHKSLLEYLGSEKMIVTSTCPATVMYIEKSSHELVQNLSKVKSPQQMAFEFIKDRPGLKVSVMPCLDKKLENFRDGVELDYIISTKEFCMLLEAHEFRKYFDAKPKEAKGYSQSWMTVKCGLGGFIGCFLDHLKLSVVETKEVSNGYTEYYIENGVVFAKVFGLKNVLNFIKRNKRGLVKYSYVEAFICPGGCINGAAQIKYDKSNEKDLNLYKTIGGEDSSEIMKGSGYIAERSFKELKSKTVNFKVEW